MPYASGMGLCERLGKAMDLFGATRKQHWLKRETTNKVIMYCGKTFEMSDIKRQRRHTAWRIEDIDCVECLGKINEIVFPKLTEAIKKRMKDAGKSKLPNKTG